MVQERERERVYEMTKDKANYFKTASCGESK